MPRIVAITRGKLHREIANHVEPTAAPHILHAFPRDLLDHATPRLDAPGREGPVHDPAQPGVRGGS
jgi:hypothetical protein